MKDFKVDVKIKRNIIRVIKVVIVVYIFKDMEIVKIIYIPMVTKIGDFILDDMVINVIQVVIINKD